MSQDSARQQDHSEQNPSEQKTGQHNPSPQNLMLGIQLMVLTMSIFAVQDGISRHLATEYNTPLVVMIRYWFFALFVIALSARHSGGLRRVATTRQPWLQAFRATLLVVEINVMVLGFVYLGLVESHAVFAAYPLLVAALSGPVLGEKVGWRRWLAIGVGFIGVLIILQPDGGVFSPYAIIPLLAALMFSLYALLTRYAARQDSAATSFFWTGTVGAVVATLIGIWFWVPMTPVDYCWMMALCITGALGHYTLIRAYDVAEASAVQPLTYLHMPFAAAIGILIFGETLRMNLAVGAALIIAAGLFTFWRARQNDR